MELRLQSYLVPFLTNIAIIFGPPLYTLFLRLPSDELTADDLKSLRTVLQNQIRARKEDSRKFDSILAENREAYLAAVELIQKQN